LQTNTLSQHVLIIGL